MMNHPSPKVCVGVITYNQSAYIREALDSVLSQRTDFDFDVLVHDDCSTDGTREIVEGYIKAHPGKIRAVFQNENQFSQGRRVVLIMLREMRGEYFALLDGDDWWIDDRKLQVQVDLLDANPDCAICQTLSIYFDESANRTHAVFPPKDRRKFHQECGDLAKGNFIQTSAVMFRSAFLPEISPEIDSLKFGDLAIFALIAQSGWIGTIDHPMAAYRIHESNIWFHKTPEARNEATREVLRFLAKHLRPEFSAEFSAAAALLADGPPKVPNDQIRPSRTKLILRKLYNIKDHLRGRLGKITDP